MKKRWTLNILFFLLLICLHCSVCAKYKIEENIMVAAIQIDRTNPKLQVTYSTKEATHDKVEVTISSNEKINKIESWILQEDKKTLKKVYTQNTTEKVIVEDLAKNITIVEIKIENIHKKMN